MGHQTVSLASPSNLIRSFETTLHGLSFGEHDAGRQRQSISSQLHSILQNWSVGLLLADHGPQELSSTASALSALLRSPLAPSIHWDPFPPEHADVIAQWYWKAASDLLLKPPYPDSSPIDEPQNTLQQAAQHLQAARVLLTLAAGAPARRSAAANIAPGDLIFVSLILQNSPDANEFERGEALASLHQLQAMRRCEALDQLFVAAFFPSLHGVLLRALQQVRPDELRSRNIAPVSQVAVLVSAAFVAHRRLLSSLPALLDVLLPMVEDVDTATRIQSLNALEQILLTLSTSDLKEYATRLAPCLRGALIWHDGGTAIPAAGLLRLVLPLLLSGPPTLADDPPREWTEGVGQLLRATDFLLNEAARGEDESTGLQCIKAAVQVAETVPEVVQSRLLRHAEKWVPAVADVMRQVARMVGNGKMEVAVFERVANAAVESIKWTWMLEKVYRLSVFEVCMCSVLETRACGERDRNIARRAARQVLVCLADCSRGEQVLSLVDRLKIQTCKYESLSAADDFFTEVRSALTEDSRIEERTKQRPAFAGKSARRFFPEVL